jgi:WD40-like Beta Propeller Repeat
VQLKGVSGIVVRDITDILHPVSRCTFHGGSYFHFVSETRLSYIVMGGSNLGAPGALYLADLGSGTTSLVRSWTYGGYASWIYAWSPDGSKLTYLSSDQAGVTWHMLSAAGDRLLASLGQVAPRNVNVDQDDAMVGFSADGQYVAVEQTFTQGKGTVSATPIQVDRVSDGSIAYSSTDGTMAAWAGTGARLLFRTNAGVQSWSPAGGLISVSSSTIWVHPIASPDGSRMAFSVLNAQGNHVGQVIDLATSAIHSLSPNPRMGAAFLNASLVWYAGETICTTATPCGGLGGPPLTGQTYIYDLGSDVETGSIDVAFFDSWPHVVGQS